MVRHLTNLGVHSKRCAVLGAFAALRRDSFCLPSDRRCSGTRTWCQSCTPRPRPRSRTCQHSWTRPRSAPRFAECRTITYLEVSCRFQLSPYNLRIVVEMAKKPTLGFSGSYWEPNYASERSRSLFRPFMGHGGAAAYFKRRRTIYALWWKWLRN